MSIFQTITPAFKELGRIRKGIPKSQGLQDLHTFRMDFRPDEPNALARFLEEYKTIYPQSINVRLAFNEIERVWSNWFTVYNTSGMLGKAGLLPGLEGWHWHYLRSNKTGELIVKDGLTKDGKTMPFDPTIPIYSYRNRKGEDVEVFARPEGKLSVMIPELQAIGYMVLITHGWYDCSKIESQLAAIKEISERVGMTLPMVPLIISRRPEQVSVSIKGRKHMEERWIINLDVRKDWGEAQFALLDKIQPGAMLPAPTALALPSNVIGPDDEPEEESGYGDSGLATHGYEANDTEDQPEANTTTATTTNPPPAKANGDRPKSPEGVKARLNEIISDAAKKNKVLKLKPELRKMVAPNLELCFAGDPASEDKRHTVLFWLFGHESTNDLTDEQAYVVYQWINAKPLPDGSGAWAPDAMSIREAQAIYAEAMRAEGQAELPLEEETQETLF
jgi:hypothetical protein